MVEIFDPLGVRRRFDGEAAGPEDLPIIVPTPDESTTPASLPIRALPDLSELLQVLGRIPIGQQGRPIPPDLLRLLLLRPGRNGLDDFDRLKVEPFAPREPMPGAIPPGDPSPPDIDPEVPRPVPLPSPDPDFFRPLDPGFVDPAFTRPLPRRGDEDRFRLPVGADGRIDERQLVPGRKFVADTDGTEWRYNGDKFIKQSSPARRLTLRQMQKRVTGQGPTAVRLSPDEMLNQANLASDKGETASALKVAGASLDADQATDFAGRAAGDANPQGALSPNMGEQMQEVFRRNSLANQAEQAAAAADAFSPPLPLTRKGSTFFDVQDPNFHKRFHPGVNPLEEEQRNFNASKVGPAGSVTRARQEAIERAQKTLQDLLERGEVSQEEFDAKIGDLGDESNPFFELGAQAIGGVLDGFAVGEIRDAAQFGLDSLDSDGQSDIQLPSLRVAEAKTPVGKGVRQVSRFLADVFVGSKLKIAGKVGGTLVGAAMEGGREYVRARDQKMRELGFDPEDEKSVAEAEKKHGAEINAFALRSAAAAALTDVAFSPLGDAVSVTRGLRGRPLGSVEKQILDFVDDAFGKVLSDTGQQAFGTINDDVNDARARLQPLPIVDGSDEIAAPFAGR